MFTPTSEKYLGNVDRVDANGLPIKLKEGVCLSTDEKPTNLENGSMLVEMDTGNFYFYDAENELWREQ